MVINPYYSKIMNMKVYWYPRPNKNNNVTIYGYLKFDKVKSSVFNSGIDCQSEEWIKGKIKNSPAKNMTLAVIEDQIRSEYLKHINQQIEVTPNQLLKSWQKQGSNFVELLDYFQKFIDKNTDSEKKKSGTILGYKNFKIILKKYLVSIKAEKILLLDINIEFCREYVKWLLEKNLSNCYINKCICSLKMLVKDGCREGILKHNTLEFMEMQKIVQKEKVYLTIDDLEKLEKIKLDNKDLIVAKDLFLLQSYTGMDYSTMQHLTAEKIKLHAEKNILMRNEKKIVLVF